MEKTPRGWLIELRGEKTHEEVADLAGISRSSYSNIENGNRDPSVEMAKKIGTALGFDWAIFFDEKRFVTNRMNVEKKTFTA